jgi:anti-sigma factor RsiW
MGAFAVVTMPVDLSRGGAAAAAQDIVETFPGTRNVALDAGAGTVRFEMIFPGNLSALITRLRSNSVPVGQSASVSLPVKNLAPEILAADPDRLKRNLSEGPPIWDVEFARGEYVLEAHMTGDRVEASIVPSSKSLHELYDALLNLGIVVESDESRPVHSAFLGLI